MDAISAGLSNFKKLGLLETIDYWLEKSVTNFSGGVYKTVLSTGKAPTTSNRELLVLYRCGGVTSRGAGDF